MKSPDRASGNTAELTAAFDILRRKFPDYEDRPQQLAMSREVMACLRDKENLLVEAGTGVGKSFAYLIPAVLTGEKAAISTASIALQDQLANKDLVFLRKILPRSFSFGILKGKNNYLCLKREREFSAMGHSYERFCEWASTTETGDKDELSFIPDFWARVCGDSDDCSSAMCPYYSDCFYYSHFRGLRKVDILVVNHHLLIYDLLSGFNLLPFHNRLIIDEAHQLEDVISHVCGSSLTYARVMWLLYRLRSLKTAVDHLFGPVEIFFRRPDAPVRSLHPVPPAVIEELKNLKGMLGLEKVSLRLQSYGESGVDDETEDRIKTTIACAGAIDSSMNDFIRQEDNDRIYYLAGNKGFIELKSSMVESRAPFAGLAGGYKSLVMTSATMTSGGDFAFIRRRLGIAGSPLESGPRFKEMIAGSPFDYKKQCMLYVERDLPRPDKEGNEDSWREGLKVIEGLIDASKGRALVLFTSYKHLDFVSKNVVIDYPFKSQGDKPPGKLIEWFKKTPGAVLLATATFWQGIDIKGEKLGLVIIVKMPFGSPGEPVYDERCRRLGGRWFTDLALPSAILTLRQGFGRLIRSAGDYGVVAVLDPRLLKSSYGGAIIASLPEMRTVHEIAHVKEFFEAISLSPDAKND